MAEFTSAVEAVQAAVEIQEELAPLNTGLAEDQQILFRIGINLGDVVIQRVGPQLEPPCTATYVLPSDFLPAARPS
jgi:class 3 adenylate cyclase